MADQIDAGVTTDQLCVFAFQDKAGDWRLCAGSISFVDGHHHKLSFAGFETRSGEGFGITATYHYLGGKDGKPAIMRATVINGRLMSSEAVGVPTMKAIMESGLPIERKE